VMRGMADNTAETRRHPRDRRLFAVHLRGTAAGVAAAALLMAALVASPRPVAAGESEDRAYAIYKTAKERFEAKDYDKALELVTQAEKIFAHPAITLLRGRALRVFGRLREAEESFKAVRDNLSQLPKPLLKVLTDEVLGVSDDMRKKGELQVMAEPASARVLVDGVEVQVPMQRWLAPGRHKVEATAEGRNTVTREVELKAGATTELKLNLLQRDGRLAIVVPGGLQGVDVLIDGASVDVEAAVRLGDRIAPRNVSAGTHDVLCRRAGKQVGVQVQVAADGLAEARCDGLVVASSVSGGGRKAVGWSGVAVGAGLFGYGVYGLGSYLGADLQDPRGVKSTNKHWLGSTYTVVGAAAAVLSYLFLVRDDSTAAAMAQPAAVPSLQQTAAVGE
jgi:hypothetical protein